ncbi:MAG: DUF2007 domain-containing protein [Planctomycetota bacterium]
MSTNEEVVIHRARTPFEAKILQALLEDAGIPVRVSGTEAMDEFSISQRGMNLTNVEVRVLADRAQDAQEIIDAAREAGTSLEDPTVEDSS